MEFNEGGRVAGSVGAALRDPDVRAVMSAYGDGCLTYYEVDIREHRSMMSPPTMRAVRSFVAEFGPEDALTVVRNFFGPPYGGFWRGKALGSDIFTKRYRYVANRMLLEG